MTLPNTVLSAPIPPYQNLPIQPQWYKPRRYLITAIQLGLTTLVTTDQINYYVIGQLVRLMIPPTFGSRELNKMTGYVLSIPEPNQVVIGINSLKATPFQLSNQSSQPQILAIGDVNTGQINNNGPYCTKTFIPGSFQDISPNPFNREFDFL